MKWLFYLKVWLFGSLVGFGIGVFFTYWIQGQIFYESIQNYLIGSASIAVIAPSMFKGFEMYKTWRDNKLTDKKEAIDSLRKHTQDLLPALQKIADTPSTSSDEYPYPLVQQHIASNNLLNDLLNGKEGITKTESSYNDYAEKILTYVKNYLELHVPEKIEKLELEHFDLLVEAIRSAHENCISVVNLNQTGAKEKLSPLAEAANSLLIDMSLQGMFNEQKSLGCKLSQLRASFKREIIKEINDINYSIPNEAKILQGHCSKCKDTKKKLK